MPSLNLYENIPRGDKDFPVELIRTHMLIKDFFIPLHWHEEIELQYILNGEGIITCNQIDYRIGPGDFLIINNNQVHQGFCTLPTLDALVTVFNMNNFVADFSETPILFQPLIRNDENIRTLFLSLFKEDECRELGYRTAMKGKLYDLLVYLMRSYAIEKPPEVNLFHHKHNLDRLNPVMDFIEENYTNPSITVQDMANLTNLSVGRFSHLFKSITGISPGAYLNQHRLRKAYNLLRKGKMNSTEIAYSVGFTDYNNFSSQFRRLYRETPSKVRNYQKRNQDYLHNH